MERSLQMLAVDSVEVENHLHNLLQSQATGNDGQSWPVAIQTPSTLRANRSTSDIPYRFLAGGWPIFRLLSRMEQLEPQGNGARSDRPEVKGSPLIRPVGHAAGCSLSPVPKEVQFLDTVHQQLASGEPVPATAARQI
eukprot:Skav225625  [mRNA]  locus=scaffold1513:5924:7803:+ [translate_table: standard]